jgi:hypothetical protein
MADFGEALKKSFDIKGPIIKTERFANMMMQNFIEMIGKIIKYTRKLIFSSFKYSKIVSLFFFIICVAILLFSKNKFGALVVLGYFFMIYVSLYFFLLFITLLIYIAILTIDNIKFWIRLHKSLNSEDPPKVTGKMIWQIFKKILIIFFIFFLLFVLGIICYGLKFASIVQNVLFDTANRLYAVGSRGVAGVAGVAGTFGSAVGSGVGMIGSMGAMGAMGAAGALGKGGIGVTNSADSFGGILRKILEKCT